MIIITIITNFKLIRYLNVMTGCHIIKIIIIINYYYFYLFILLILLVKEQF